MFVMKHYISGTYISKNKSDNANNAWIICLIMSNNAKPSAYYFYVKTKISVEFRICINVP